MLAALHGSSQSLVSNIRRVLGELHRSKKLGGVGGVDSMLVRLYEPILFRALAAANAGVRRNALLVLLDAFPLLVSPGGVDRLPDVHDVLRCVWCGRWRHACGCVGASDWQPCFEQPQSPQCPDCREHMLQCHVPHLPASSFGAAGCSLTPGGGPRACGPTGGRTLINTVFLVWQGFVWGCGGLQHAGHGGCVAPLSGSFSCPPPPTTLRPQQRSRTSCWCGCLASISPPPPSTHP
jgi:hypothetical protein